MDAAEVEVALWRYISNVGRDLPLLAQLPDDRRGCRIVDGDQHHVGSVQVGGLEVSVDVGHLVLRDTEGDFIVESRLRTDDGDAGIGVEAVEDTTSSDLERIWC